MEKIIHSSSMEPNTRCCRCKLCSRDVYEDECIDHMQNCVDLYGKYDNVIEVTAILQKYFILLYILGYIGDWRLKFPLHNRNNFRFMFQIYEHSHHLKTNTLWKSTLLGSDNFIRLVLSVVEFPVDHYLQIPPPLVLRNFDDNPVITNLNFLFTRTQI